MLRTYGHSIRLLCSMSTESGVYVYCVSDLQDYTIHTDNVVVFDIIKQYTCYNNSHLVGLYCRHHVIKPQYGKLIQSVYKYCGCIYCGCRLCRCRFCVCRYYSCWYCAYRFCVCRFSGCRLCGSSDYTSR